jgi:cell division inhibitor SepF
MGFSDLWSRTLVYFGIAEEEEWDDDGYATTEQIEEYGRREGDADYDRRERQRERQNVRRLPSAPEADEWSAEEEAAAAATSSRRRRGGDREQSRPARLRSVDPGAPAKVHLVVPRSFNDAQQIADRFKAQMPVIVNLQGSDTDLSKRLIDFASGLTYALDGSMQRVADKVFLLTPRNVELSAEERARALERGGFYNQA